MSYEHPYAGLKVLEISQGYAARYCAMMLAQYGAEVVKIEPPHGDWVRGVGRSVGDQSSLSIVPNLGKKNLALDLKSDEGKAIAQRLAAEADVIVEAGRPGVTAKLGLGYDQVKADNPGVIYVSVSGFGQTGPYNDRPVTDTVMQSFSGLMAPKLIEHTIQPGEQSQTNAPAGSYQTKDGWIAVTLIKEDHWRTICRCLAREELASDPRFASFAARAENLEELLALLRPVFRERSTAEWSAIFRENDILSNPINDVGSWLEDPQVLASELAPAVTQPHTGPMPIVHLPGTAAPREGDPKFVAPLTGAHSREVLSGLGYSDKDIDAMASRGVVKLTD